MSVPVIRNIQEIIPLTIQGEGYHVGRSCSFVRLFGCPVGCWFCDTGYAPSDRKQLSDLPKYSLPYNALRDQLKSNFVVISGGEPVYHPDLKLLLMKLIKDDFEVAIETSGAKDFEFTEFPQVWITLSPKAHVSQSSNPSVAEEYWARSNEIKLVISDVRDFEYYEELLDRASQLGTQIYLQPEWSKKKESAQIILKILEDKPHWKISFQVHKYLGLA